MSGDKLKELETEIATYEAARDSRKNREDVEESVRKKFHTLCDLLNVTGIPFEGLRRGYTAAGRYNDYSGTKTCREVTVLESEKLSGCTLYVTHPCNNLPTLGYSITSVSGLCIARDWQEQLVVQELIEGINARKSNKYDNIQKCPERRYPDWYEEVPNAVRSHFEIDRFFSVDSNVFEIRDAMLLVRDAYAKFLEHQCDRDAKVRHTVTDLVCSISPKMCRNC